MVEHVRRKVLGLSAVLHAFHNIGVDTLEVAFVEIGKASGIPLRSFNQKPLVRLLRQSLQQVLRGLDLHEHKRQSREKSYRRTKRFFENAVPNRIKGLPMPLNVDQIRLRGYLFVTWRASVTSTFSDLK
jgi:hypothetical protein